MICFSVNRFFITVGLYIKVKEFWGLTSDETKWTAHELMLGTSSSTVALAKKMARSVARPLLTLNIASHRRYRQHEGFAGGDLHCVAENRLDLQFDPALTSTRWVTDFIYVRTQEGCLYATVVMDAVLMAIWHRQPKTPVLVHSDQGARYTSRDWLDFLREHRLEVSMSRRGYCHDNAVAESFFSSMKLKRIKNKIYASWDEARLDLRQHIEGYYNY